VLQAAGNFNFLLNLLCEWTRPLTFENVWQGSGSRRASGWHACSFYSGLF
jgi:hypothetical protein